MEQYLWGIYSGATDKDYSAARKKTNGAEYTSQITTTQTEPQEVPRSPPLSVGNWTEIYSDLSRYGVHFSPRVIGEFNFTCRLY
ncbi:hypothetical protein BaRGS_00023286 [Batillaria attramentaria]|uniref:Uncharacterized protein n=1 Tax=Batillaria attramentaria TaxID=370345 RepID=A0ABD0KEC8_9CAEN